MSPRNRCQTSSAMAHRYCVGTSNSSWECSMFGIQKTKGCFFQLMVNGWFRARWFGFLGSPKMIAGLLLKGWLTHLVDLGYLEQNQVIWSGHLTNMTRFYLGHGRGELNKMSFSYVGYLKNCSIFWGLFDQESLDLVLRQPVGAM